MRLDECYVGRRVLIRGLGCSVFFGFLGTITVVATELVSVRIDVIVKRYGERVFRPADLHPTLTQEIIDAFR